MKLYHLKLFGRAACKGTGEQRVTDHCMTEARRVKCVDCLKIIKANWPDLLLDQPNQSHAQPS